MGALVLCAFAHGAHPAFPSWPAGLAAWSAAAVLWPRVDRKQRRFALILGALGAIALFAALQRGLEPDWGLVFTQSTALLGMLGAVSFLQLVGVGGAPRESLPVGRRALWQTVAGVHVLGAVINISVVFIVGERLAHAGGLSIRQAVAIGRGFLLAALWSPFFGAMAVALTYAPGAHLADLALVGAPLAAMLVGVAQHMLPPPSPGEPAEFVGFPLRPSALWLPLLLTVVVAAGHFLRPGWSSLAIISGAALTMTAIVVVARDGVGEGIERLAGHASRRLPAMSGELVLFLAAGVFAAGLQALMQGDVRWLPFDRFGALEAALVLALMIVAAGLGVHPVVSIVTAAAWLAPLSPEPTLLASMFLMSWGIGLAINPMSGVHLSLQGRFGLPALALARANLRYCAVACAMAVVWLFVVALWRGVA